jgi:hypothetical protein
MHTTNHISQFVIIVTAIACFWLAGCHSEPTYVYRAPPEPVVTTPPPPPPTEQPDPAYGKAIRIEDLARAIQTAPDAIAEAQAIERLRQFEKIHNMTYTIQTTRLDLNRQIDDASATNLPIRADLSVFQGQRPVYNFSFTPKDNRNLALLGQ